MGFAKASAARTAPFSYSISLADGEGLILCDSTTLGPDPESVFTVVNPGARKTVSGDNGNVLSRVEIRTSAQDVHWSRNQLDLSDQGDDTNVHLLEADEEPLVLTNVSKVCVLNDSGNTTEITVTGILTRRANRNDAGHPGGLVETAKPLTADSTRWTADTTYITADQTEYR